MRRAFSLLALSLFASASVASAAWDGELALQGEGGFATRAQSRGVEQARAGAFAALRLQGESFHGEAAWHQSFRRRDERLGALRFGYEVWESAEGASVELRAAHRRFTKRSDARGAVHASEFGVRFAAAPRHGFVPSLSYDRDFRRDADIVEARVDREFALTRWGAFLNTSAFAGYVDADNVSPDRAGSPVRDAYAYVGAEARLPYRIGERTMLVLAAEVSSAEGASGAWSALSRAGRTRAGLSLSVTFDF